MPNIPSHYLVADRQQNSQTRDVQSLDLTGISGRVFTVGDIHGAQGFKDLIRFIHPENKIVLVGDLMDRGEDNYANLQIIIQNQACFAAVRGNHEEFFMKYMRARRKKEKGQKLSNIENGHIESFLINGGDWANRILLKDLEKIEQYIETLPYILKITLSDNKEFLVTHADMSFLSDKAVEEKLSGDGMLSTDEKAIVTWARKDGKEVPFESYPTIRTKDSTPVYCGHNITIKNNGEVIRKDTNHINLDFGAYTGVPLVGVEHPGKVVVFGVFGIKVTDVAVKTYFDQLFCLHQKMGEIEFTNKETEDKYNAHLKSNNFLPSRKDLTHIDFSKVDVSRIDLSDKFITANSMTTDQLHKAKWVHIQFYNPNGEPDFIRISREQFDQAHFQDIEDLINHENEINHENLFLTDFLKSLQKSHEYQKANIDEKFNLFEIATKLVSTYDQSENKLTDKQKEDIIKTAINRVLALEKFGLKDPLLKICATGSLEEIHHQTVKISADTIRGIDKPFSEKMDKQCEKWERGANLTTNLSLIQKPNPKLLERIHKTQKQKSSRAAHSEYLKNRYLIAAYQAEKYNEIKKPSDSRQLIFLIDLLEKKLMEYEIRSYHGYEKNTADQKKHEAEWMKQYLQAMHEALFKKNQSFSDFIREASNKKWDRTSGIGIPSQPKHTFGSELNKIYDDMKKFVHTHTETNLKKAQKAYRAQEEKIKNGQTSLIAELDSIIASLKVREIEYARRIACDNSKKSIGFFRHRLYFGISAKDKLAATHDLIAACEALKRSPKSSEPFKLEFSSESAKAAAHEGTLHKEYNKIFTLVTRTAQREFNSPIRNTTQTGLRDRMVL